MISARRRRPEAQGLAGSSRTCDAPELSLALRVGPLLGFLREIGADRVIHTGRRYGAHLAGVYRKLDLWGYDHEVSAAGFFHSIYGTERFREYVFPLLGRGDLSRLIGPRAESLAYANCAMVRSGFDKAVESHEAPYLIPDRFSGEMLTLDERDFRDLMAIHLADWLEQVNRATDPHHRQELYARLAGRLGGPARAASDLAFQRTEERLETGPRDGAGV